jgi:hypothetical protein
MASYLKRKFDLFLTYIMRPKFEEPVVPVDSPVVKTDNGFRPRPILTDKPYIQEEIKIKISDRNH